MRTLVIAMITTGVLTVDSTAVPGSRVCITNNADLDLTWYL